VAGASLFDLQIMAPMLGNGLTRVSTDAPTALFAPQIFHPGAAA
jgi:hypothetical protein